MKRTRKTWMLSRNVVLWGLVAMLALLLVAAAGAQGGVGAGVRGSTGAEGQRSRGAAVQPQTSEVLQTSEVSQPLTVIYTYDDAGRLVSVDYGEGYGITYTYDAAGNLLSRAMNVPTPTPTVTPTETPTPIATSTPTPTATPSVTPTPTVMLKLYLPMLLKSR